MGQPSDTKRKANPNNNQNGAKRQHNEAHNADAEGTVQSANIAIHDENVAYHVAKDGLIDVISDSENLPSPVENNKVIHELYDWLADTGTTSHITHRRDAFATYQLVLKIPVNLAGKNVSYAIGKGTIFLQSECDGIIHTLQLNDVLHIPNTEHSLLSLGRWEQETGRQFHVQYGKMTLLTKEGVGVARGIRLSNRLYQMSFVLSRIPENAEFAFHAKIYQPTWEAWH